MADQEMMPTPEAPPVRPESSQEMPEQSGGFESPKAPEAAQEAQPVPMPASAAPAPAPAPAASAKDPTTVKVESILEEGLGETYKALDPGTQGKFRKEGERVTGEIVGMMRRAKMKARKVLDLIRGWLKIIPHINRHYLDQEAKIKTDRVMHLSEREKEETL